MSSEAGPRLPTGKLLQAIAMDAVLVIAGVWAFLETGEFGWLIAALIGGGVVAFFMLVKPLMDAAKQGGRHVD